MSEQLLKAGRGRDKQIGRQSSATKKRAAIDLEQPEAQAIDNEGAASASSAESTCEAILALLGSAGQKTGTQAALASDLQGEPSDPPPKKRKVVDEAKQAEKDRVAATKAAAKAVAAAEKQRRRNSAI